MGLQFMKMQILEIGILILAAYIGGLIAKKINFGEVIGQILGGVIVGPHFLELVRRFFYNHIILKNYFIFKPVYRFYDSAFPVYAEVFESYHFFVFLFLGIVAFSLGEELHRDRLRQVGIKATIICILQAFLTWVFLSAGFWLIFDFTLINALLLGSIGIATAPALTFILMSKLEIEGKLKNILANIVVLDDIIEVIFFSIFLGISVVIQEGNKIAFAHIAKEVVLELFFACFVGVLIFLVLKFTIKKRLPSAAEQDEPDSFLSTMLSKHPTPSIEILFIMFSVIAIGLAVSIHFNLPFLITAVVAGFLISNFHSHAIFDSLRIGDVMPIFNLMFFAIIGSTVRLESFSKETFIFVDGYIILRSAGKIFGTWFGCKITKQDPKITACLPKLMLPQAGMAAVETIMVATVLAKSGGLLIFNTIIPALVVFELGGAYLSEKTLLKWKTWLTGEKEALESKTKEESDFLLSKILNNRVIEMLATTKEEAVFELASVIVKEKDLLDITVLTQPILEREKLTSTGIGNGIAFPHCRTNDVDEVIVVCGILKNAIDWNSIDKNPVDLIFLIISPKAYPEQHLKALKALSCFAKKPDIKNGLYQALKDQKIEYFCLSIENT